MKKRIAAEIFHPGVFLEEEIEERGWSQIDLAEIIGKTPSDINLIINGKRSITPETAIAFGDAFGTGAELWMNLETQYQLSQAEYKQDVSLKAELYDKYPVREMIRRGWIEPSSNIEVLISRFKEFFKGSNFAYAAKKGTSYKEENTVSQGAWFQRAKQLAKACTTENRFSKARLKKCFEKLRLLIHEAEEIRHIPKLMSETGIRFVIVECMPNTKIDGATFWLDDNSPVIVLSLFYDRIDNFWFTLIHELSHVTHGEGKDKEIIDVDIFSETSNDNDLPEFEKRANKDASEFCVPTEALENFILRIHPYYLAAKIEAFAYLHKTNPGVVVGQLQHRHKTTGRGVPYSHHRKFLVKARGLLLGSALTDGYGYMPRF